MLPLQGAIREIQWILPRRPEEAEREVIRLILQMRHSWSRRCCFGGEIPITPADADRADHGKRRTACFCPMVPSGHWQLGQRKLFQWRDLLSVRGGLLNAIRR